MKRLESLAERTARDAFAKWLEKNGATILEPTNEWELLRFKGGNGTGVLYTNAKRRLTATAHLLEVFSAYADGRDFLIGTRRKKRDKRQQMVDRLIVRDGHTDCFYCLHNMPETDRTLEHLVDLKYQGPDNLHNLVLAHAKCNNELSHLTPIEKLRIHDQAVIRRYRETIAKPFGPVVAGLLDHSCG